MATTPTLTLCDQLVTLISTAWGPTSPDAVSRVYQFSLLSNEFQGRRVYVFPTDYGYEPADRSEARFDHRITIVTVERYADPGLPDNTWCDARVDFVYEKLVAGLWYGFEGPLLFSSRSVVSRRADVVVLDIPKLTTTPAVFLSQVDLEYEEVQAV